MHTKTPRIAWQTANARRMARQGLTAPLDEPVAGVVTAMCGAHAQVMSAAELAIGLRTIGVTRSDVRAALWKDGSLIKTFGPRGTIHLLPARDLHRWVGALSAVPAPTSMSGDARLTAEQADEVMAAIDSILADGERTIDELDEAVRAATGSWAGDLVMPAFGGYWPRWRQVITTAAHRGLLCFGPNRGRKVTYTSPRNALADFAPANADEGLTWLLSEYLRVYGPATPGDLAKWLAAPLGWTKNLFATRKDTLERVELEGREARIVAGDNRFPESVPPTVRLLPYFDAFAVASQPRELLFPGATAERALAGGQAGNFPVLLVEGVVAGVWHQRRSGKRIVITVEPLRELSSSQRAALDVEVERVAHILEVHPELTIGSVTVGPHA